MYKSDKREIQHKDQPHSFHVHFSGHFEPNGLPSRRSTTHPTLHFLNCILFLVEQKDLIVIHKHSRNSIRLLRNACCNSVAASDSRNATRDFPSGYGTLVRFLNELPPTWYDVCIVGHD